MPITGQQQAAVNRLTASLEQLKHIETQIQSTNARLNGFQQRLTALTSRQAQIQTRIDADLAVLAG